MYFLHFLHFDKENKKSVDKLMEIKNSIIVKLYLLVVSL
jgi:hypothetical protein